MRYLITAALPYANGDLHIGHVRSTYFPADFYNRLLVLNGVKSVYVCGTDEHGTPIVVAAEREGKKPKEYVDFYHTRILNSLKKAGVAFDWFSRTTNEKHHELTRYFFKLLKENGYIFKSEVEQFYCPNCKRSLPDRFVRGTCPYCGARDQYGDYCEKCGRVFKSGELKDARCAICGSEPEKKLSKHYFFDLPQFTAKLKTWIKEEVKLQADVKNFVLSWIRAGLQAWDITRDLEWGVKVPGNENLVFYVWFDAPIGYVTATVEYCEQANENWEDYWKNKETKIVHFIGKDIIYHHCIFWPAMLMGTGEFTLPFAISVRGHVTLEGKKMSKSRRWYILLDDFLKKLPSDYLRFYYAYTTPQSVEDGDFSARAFKELINKTFIGEIANLLHRVATLAKRHFNGRIERPKKLSERGASLLQLKAKLAKAIANSIATIELKALVEAALDVARACNAYLNEVEPWRKAREKELDEASECLYVELELLKVIAISLSPFVPDFAKNALALLGIKEKISVKEIEKEVDVYELGEVKPLLKPVENEVEELLPAR